MRCFCLLMISLAMTGALAAEGLVQWTCLLGDMPHSPTLFPNAEQPVAVAVAAGTEVVLIGADGLVRWRSAFDVKIAAPVTVADLDADGEPELAAALISGEVVCLNAEGVLLWRRSFADAATSYDCLAAGDLHPDAGLELVFGFKDGWLHCVNSAGETLWRFFGDPYSVGPPALGDVDHDGVMEVVYGTDNGNIYCLSGDGRVKWRYSEGAPYGRSGVNIADLDKDGRPEVLITRSNTGLDRCLMALDGLSGAPKWRTEDVMQSYCSNALADLDGDGLLEVLHADKSNHVYCTGAQGVEAWRAPLAGRGIFWAPVVADLNGDGRLEIFSGVRDKDAQVGATHFLMSAEGAVLEKLTLGVSGNAAPAVADLNGDGVLEALVATKNPNALQALSWGGGGQVAWPSLRGDSAMTAATALASAKAASQELQRADAPARVEKATWYLGANELEVHWDHPAPDRAYIECRIAQGKGRSETHIYPVALGACAAQIAWRLPYQGRSEIEIRVMASQVARPLAAWSKRIRAEAPDSCDMRAVVTACEKALKTGQKAGVDSSGLRLRLIALDALRQEVISMAQQRVEDALIAAKASALRREAQSLKQCAKALEEQWRGGRTGRVVYWRDENPWDRFDPLYVPEVFGEGEAIALTLCGNEFEDLALTLLNTGSKSVDLRCVFAEPSFSGKARPEPPLAKQISLRRGIRIPGRRCGMVMDALPELDRSRCISLPPGEPQQLWLVVSSYGLKPGLHELTLYLGAIGRPAEITAIPLKITVLPVELPVGVYAQMNWVGCDVEETSAQQLQDMLDHGISVSYGPHLPTLRLDAEGNLAAAVDWSRTDAGLARLPEYFQVLFHRPPKVQWPEDCQVTPARKQAGFATAVRVLVAHLAEKGWGYERWAFYPYDEPWLTGFTIIPQLRDFCEQVRAADPQVRLYTDPTGLLRKEYVAEFKDLIDIWQPEMNILKRDPALRAWFAENAASFWAYEATDPGKDLLPLGYYRGYAWLAWLLGLDGAGFWCYKYYDIYWPLEMTHWSVVYQNNDEVTPSRRWEAVRDGQEDYRLFYLLREEIGKAQQAGRSAEAQEAQDLQEEAVDTVIGWQVERIDEITRQTCPYELDYAILQDYREKICSEIMALRQGHQ